MRKKFTYFKPREGMPAPIVHTVKHRVSFSEVDAMAIVWHGRYPQYFEQASEALSQRIGLSYAAYAAHNLRAPIVQLHTDYHKSPVLAEELTIEARLMWDDAARLNTEFTIYKADHSIATTGYTVQMFTCGQTGQPHLVIPELYATIQDAWRKGEFHDK